MSEPKKDHSILEELDDFVFDPTLEDDEIQEVELDNLEEYNRNEANDYRDE